MYKRFILSLALIAILAMLVGIAAAPVTAGPRSVRLVSVGYYREKGVVFKFKITGDFKNNELKGSVLVGDKPIKVYCVRKENDPSVNSQCVAASVTSRLAGKQGVISFAGSSFAFIVPARNYPR